MNTVDVGSGTIALGQQGENLITQVRFPIAQMVTEYGQGVFTLFNQRHNDFAPYIVETYSDGEFLYWNVTDTDTMFAGDGKCELQYVVGDVLKKSIVYITLVSNALWDGQPIQPQMNPHIDPMHRAKPYPPMPPGPPRHKRLSPQVARFNFGMEPNGNLMINNAEWLSGAQFKLLSDGYLEVTF